MSYLDWIEPGLIGIPIDLLVLTEAGSAMCPNWTLQAQLGMCYSSSWNCYTNTLTYARVSQRFDVTTPHCNYTAVAVMKSPIMQYQALSFDVELFHILYITNYSNCILYVVSVLMSSSIWTVAAKVSVLFSITRWISANLAVVHMVTETEVPRTQETNAAEPRTSQSYGSSAVRSSCSLWEPSVVRVIAMPILWAKGWWLGNDQHIHSRIYIVLSWGWSVTGWRVS